MFGTNRRYKKDFVDAPNLVVNSIFPTIQGEGPFTGEPAVFLRLSQCNLACTFCDTEFEKGTKMTPEEVLLNIEQAASEINTKLLVITGGEPLLQDFSVLLKLLIKKYPHWKIQIETAGTVWQKALENVAFMGYITYVVSPKTPLVHSDIFLRAGCWKYIVKDGWVADDGLPDMPTQPGLTKRTKLARPNDWGKVYVQPVDEQDATKNKHNLEFAARIAMKHGYHLSVQIHKIAGLE